MEIIVFRGKSRKGWLFGDLIHNRGKVYIAPPGIASPFAEEGDFEVDKESVGMFTGMYDKHGSRIFEGDWVELDGKEMFYISYNHRRGMFCLQIGDAMVIPYTSFINGLEVIGNVYDNPIMHNKKIQRQ